MHLRREISNANICDIHMLAVGLYVLYALMHVVNAASKFYATVVSKCYTTVYGIQ